jgi:hypothetical protein
MSADSRQGSIYVQKPRRSAKMAKRMRHMAADPVAEWAFDSAQRTSTGVGA